MSEAAPAAASAFRGPILRGLAWKGTSRVLFEASRLAVAVVLARLLTPGQYGLAGMVLVLIAFEPVLSGVAVASALVQRKTLSEADRSTVFWTTAAVGFASSAAGIALSGPVARFYGEPDVQPLFAALSCCFAVSSLGLTHAHLLVREMDFRSLELRAMAATVVGAAVAIGVAASGGGAWALVAQQLGVVCTSTLLLWTFSPWRPGLTYSRRSLREVRSFGGNVSGTLMLFQLNQNTDNVLIGRFLGAAPLGAYALAYNVILVPFSRLASPLHEVLYPVFSRLQTDLAALVSMWLRAVRLMAAVAAPSMLVLIAVAPDLVSVVFGDRWEPAVPVVRILAWVGLLLALQGLNSVLLQAIGRTTLLFRYALVAFVAGVTSFVLGLQWGIVGVAACFAVAATVLHVAYMGLTARAVGSGFRAYAAAISSPLWSAAAASAAAAIVRVPLEGAPPGARLAAAAGVAAAVYLPLCAPALLSELRALRPQRAG